jgi:hypothetical protein
MAEYTDETPMPFGMHRGKKLIDVPASYLIYIEGQLKRDDWRELQQYIKDNRDVLEKEAKENSRG